MIIRREATMFITESAAILLLIFIQLNYFNSIVSSVQLLLYFAFICTGVYALYRLFHDERAIPLFDKVKPLLLGFILASSFFFLSYILTTDGGKKRLFIASGSNGYGFINFQLFEDNTFKLVASGAPDGKIYRGTYTVLNDTLYLGNKELKYLYPSLKLAVKDGVNGVKYLEPVGGDIVKNMLFIDPAKPKSPLWDNFTTINQNGIQR